MKTNNELTTYSRGCVQTCEEGCTNAGQIYERCFKCCNDEDHCNDSEGSSFNSACSLGPLAHEFTILYIFAILINHHIGCDWLLKS